MEREDEPFPNRRRIAQGLTAQISYLTAPHRGHVHIYPDDVYKGAPVARVISINVMAGVNCEAHAQGSGNRDPLVETLIVETGSPGLLPVRHFGHGEPHPHPNASVYNGENSAVLLTAFVYDS